MKTKLGVGLAVLYLLVCAYLIATQGLFGESFIALILGLPWSLVPSYFEFGGTENAVITAALLFAPIALNAYLLYVIGKYIGTLIERRSSNAPNSPQNSL